MSQQETAKPVRDRRLWAGVGIFTTLTAIASAIVGLSGPKAQASSAPSAAQQGIPVSVAAVQEQEVQLWDEFSGRLEAVERVEVRPRVAGQVQQLHFREGMLVKKGDLLVTLDPAPYAAEVERAAAQVAAAQARVSRAQGEHERAQRLWEDRAISQRDFEDRLNAAREADANLRGAQAQLAQTNLNLDYTRIRAPIAGRIGRFEITAGNLVSAGAGAPVLATLVSVDPIYASFDTDEQVVVRALGQLPGGASARALIGQIPVRIETEGAGPATAGPPQGGRAPSGGSEPRAAGSVGATSTRDGRLQLIDNQVDAKSGTIRARAAFSNADGSLLPGQFARIRMGQARSSRAVLVSERAVGTDQNKKFVWVVNAQNQAEYREVTLGASLDGQRVVTAGLKSGERIVVNGLQRVRPGALLQPQAAAPAVAAKS